MTMNNVGSVPPSSAGPVNQCGCRLECREGHPEECSCPVFPVARAILLILSLLVSSPAALYETGRIAPPGRLQGGFGLMPLHIYEGPFVGDVLFRYFERPELFGSIGLANGVQAGVSWNFAPGITFTLNCTSPTSRGCLNPLFSVSVGYFDLRSLGYDVQALQLGISAIGVTVRPAKSGFGYMMGLGLKHTAVTGLGAEAGGDALELDQGVAYSFGRRALFQVKLDFFDEYYLPVPAFGIRNTLGFGLSLSITMP